MKIFTELQNTYFNYLLIKFLKFFLSLKLIIFLILIVVSLSCKKDNIELPKYKVIQPSENAIFTENDTINFKIQLLNNIETEYLQISIVDESMNIVSSQFQYNPVFTNSNYSSDFPIKLHNSLSGNYYLKFQLFNKSLHASSEFVKLNVTTIPDSALAVYVITEGLNNTLNINKLDLNGNLISSFTINSDYSSSDINSLSKSLLICGRYVGPISSYSTETHNLQWSKPAINNPPFPYFESMNFDGKFASVGLYDGNIRGYNSNGLIIFSFNIGNYRPYNFTRHFDVQSNIAYYIFLASDIQNIFHRIFVNFSASYSNMQIFDFNWKPYKIFALKNNSFIVFGNENNNAVMKTYSINSNIMNNIRNLPNDSLYDVIEISNGKFVISTSKYMFHYDVYTDNLTQFTLNQGYQKLAYDKVNNKLWATKDFKLKRLNLLNFSPEFEIQFNEKILNTHILYKK